MAYAPLCHAAARSLRARRRWLSESALTRRCSSSSGATAGYTVAGTSTLPPPVPCFWADWAEVPLPEGHRFPMDKYRTVRLQLENDPSLTGRLQLVPSPLASLSDVTRVHCPTYVDAAINGTLSPAEQRAIGFPWSRAHVQRSLASTGGTVAATRLVLSSWPKVGLRCAMQVAGGTHHAHRSKGGGFCVFNDIACAAAAAMDEAGVSRVLVIDLDVHRGDGTAAIFAEEPRVTTFSMHGYNNYGNRTGLPSDYDVDLPDATSDEVYLQTLNAWLPRLFDTHMPELVFFQAGVDALVGDSFGRLAVSRAGLQARNNAVYTACLQAGVPLVITMGGGYTRPIDASVEAHADVFRTAALRFSVP